MYRRKRMLPSPEEALAGAQDILAEMISDEAKYRRESGR